MLQAALQPPLPTSVTAPPCTLLDSAKRTHAPDGALRRSWALSSSTGPLTEVTEPACDMSTSTEQVDRSARQKACSGALPASLQAAESVR